jgi:YD repeat-containing protein
VDVCIANDGYKKAYLNLIHVPDLLVTVSNGLGGSTGIEYTPSTAYENYYPNKTGKLPFAAQAVSKVTLNDGQGNRYTNKYFYKDGYFDAADREFRGFGYVKAIDGEGNFSESYFKQDAILKGRIYRQEIRDVAGKLLTKKDNTWLSLELYDGVNFPYLSQTDNYAYDNEGGYRQTRVKYEYDTYGNPAKVISEGDVVIQGDEKTQITEYAYNTADWIVSLPKHIYLVDAANAKVSEKWFYYDNHSNIDEAPDEGILTKEESWLHNPVTAKSDRISAQYSYDEYGNLITVTDVLGRVTTTVYDSLCRSYPVCVTNALGQSMETVYYGINVPEADTIVGYGLPGR